MTIHFKQKYEWAVLPQKPRAVTAAEEAEVYERSFRWYRRSRYDERCWPRKVAQEIGWLVPSPISAKLSALEDVEIACAKDDLPSLAQATGYDEIWPRAKSTIAVRRTSWLRMFDVKVDGGWRSMFVPNGQGSVEWHLGWEMHFPETHLVLVLPIEHSDGLFVPMGVMDYRTVQRLNSSTGFSIAVQPTRNVDVIRGQPIARLILLHRDSLQMRAAFSNPFEERTDTEQPREPEGPYPSS